MGADGHRARGKGSLPTGALRLSQAWSEEALAPCRRALIQRGSLTNSQHCSHIREDNSWLLRSCVTTTAGKAHPAMHASASTSSVAAAGSSAFPAPILPAANLPPTEPFEYGEAVFHRRRAAWLAEASDSPSSSRTVGGGGSGPKRSAPAPRSSSSSGPDASLRRLEELLALCEQGAGDDIPSGLWKAGLENVHRGLIGGRSEFAF